MIKTLAYNDFSTYTYTQLRDKEFLLEECKKFVASGGNLDLPLKTNEYQKDLESFNDFILKEYDEQFFLEVVQNNLITNPFKFTVKDSVVYQHYPVQWLQINVKKFQAPILAGIKELAIYRGELAPLEGRHPLIHLGLSLGDPEVWDIILTHGNINTSIKAKYANNINTALVFYRHGLIPSLENYEYKIQDMLEAAIIGDDIAFIDKIKKDIDLPEYDKILSKNDKLFLSCRSTEMASKLLDIGLEYAQERIYINGNASVDMVDTIISKAPAGFMDKYHDHLFEKFFQVDNMPMLKMLVEKHKFPIEKYDAYDLSYKNSQPVESMKWLLTQGADPRVCVNFIRTVIRKRDIKTLNLYKKEGLINIYSPDVLYQFCRNDSLTQPFFKLLEKASSEQLAQLTKNNLPAWFGINNISNFKFFQKKIPTLNVLSPKGYSWLFCLLANKNVTSKIYKELEGIGPLSHEGVFMGNNILHMALNLTYINYDSIEPIKLLCKNPTINIGELIMQKNDQGNFPLDLLLRSPSDNKYFSSGHYQEAIINCLLEHLKDKFPLEQVIAGKAMWEHIKHPKLEQFYTLYLKNKLSNGLEEKVAKPKVKI